MITLEKTNKGEEFGYYKVFLGEEEIGRAKRITEKHNKHHYILFYPIDSDKPWQFDSYEDLKGRLGAIWKRVHYAKRV